MLILMQHASFHIIFARITQHHVSGERTSQNCKRRTEERMWIEHAKNIGANDVRKYAQQTTHTCGTKETQKWFNSDVFFGCHFQRKTCCVCVASLVMPTKDIGDANVECRICFSFSFSDKWPAPFGSGFDHLLGVISGCLSLSFSSFFRVPANFNSIRMYMSMDVPRWWCGRKGEHTPSVSHYTCTHAIANDWESPSSTSIIANDDKSMVHRRS